MLCLLCKTHVGASARLSLCMHLHMTIFAYLHMCMNTCSTCGRWEAKGTFSRLTRPKFDPPSTGWVFLSACWGSRRKNPSSGWRMQQDRGCRRIKKNPAHQLGAKELTQHTGFAVSRVMLPTSLDSTDVLSSLGPNARQQKLAWRWVSPTRHTGS